MNSHGDPLPAADRAAPVLPVVGTPPPAPARVRLLATLLVAGAFAIVLAGVQSTVFDLERHQVPKALALHLTALASLLILRPSWRRIQLDATGALFAAFVAWSALSAALATNRWLALHGAGITFSGLLLFLGARRVARAGRSGRVIAGLATAAVLAGAFGMAQAYGADWSWFTDSRPPGGTFGNRNFLAHLLAIATPLLALLVLRAATPGAILALLGLLLATGAIVLTRSRAAWLGAAAALLVMAAGALVARRTLATIVAPRRMLLVGAALAAGAAAAILVPNSLDWRSDSPYAETLTRITSYTEGSGRGRLIQYENSLRLVPDAPIFGVGPGNWFVHYPRVTSRGDPAFDAGDPIPTNPWPSSDWMALLVERGAIGALLLLATIGSAALASFRRLRAEPHAALAAIALLGTLVAVVVTGAFDAVLLLAAPTFFFTAALGLLLPDGPPVLTRLPARALRRTVAVAAVGIGIVLSVATAGQLAAIVLTDDGASRAALQRAARLDPGSHRLRLLLARRGSCANRLPHAHAAERLMPHHDAPARALRACGERPDR